jgi:hypothetical protein
MPRRPPHLCNSGLPQRGHVLELALHATPPAAYVGCRTARARGARVHDRRRGHQERVACGRRGRRAPRDPHDTGPHANEQATYLHVVAVDMVPSLGTDNARLGVLKVVKLEARISAYTFHHKPYGHCGRQAGLAMTQGV